MNTGRSLGSITDFCSSAVLCLAEGEDSDSTNGGISLTFNREVRTKERECRIGPATFGSLPLEEVSLLELSSRSWHLSRKVFGQRSFISGLKSGVGPELGVVRNPSICVSLSSIPFSVLLRSRTDSGLHRYSPNGPLQIFLECPPTFFGLV